MEPSNQNGHEALHVAETMIRRRTTAAGATSADQIETLRKLVHALKRIPPGEATSERAQLLLRELVAWQMDVQKAVFLQRLHHLRTTEDQRDPGVARIKAALEQMIQALDEARRGALTPSPVAIQVLQRAHDRARRACQEAGAALTKAPSPHSSLPQRVPLDVGPPTRRLFRAVEEPMTGNDYAVIPAPRDYCPAGTPIGAYSRTKH